MNESIKEKIDEILAFWFEDTTKKQKFTKDPEFDALIKENAFSFRPPTSCFGNLTCYIFISKARWAAEMRELLFKQNISEDRKKAELLCLEFNRTQKSVQRHEKKFVYTVKDILEFESEDNLRQYLKQKKIQPVFPQIHIIRTHKSKTGQKQVVAKIIADHYITSGTKIIIVKAVYSVKRVIYKPGRKAVQKKNIDIFLTP